MAQRRPTNPFLDAANRKLGEEQAKQDSAQRAATAGRKSEDAQNGFFSEHLRPLIAQLTALPKKDGRAFEVKELRFVGPETNPRLFLTLEYIGGAYKPNMMRGGRMRGPSPSDAVSIHLVDFVDDIRFTAEVTRRDRYDAADSTRHDTRAVMSVDEMMEVLGDFVASVAPDRIAELGGAAVEPVPKSSSQASKDLWGNVANQLEGLFDDLPRDAPKQLVRPSQPPKRGLRR